MRITANDLAKMCGVSRGTVDRALHGRSGINEKTRQRILDIANEHDYRPHIIARGLVKGRSFNIGVVSLSIRGNFLPELIFWAECTARQEGYFTFITDTNMDPVEETKCIEHLLDRSIDGLILQSVKSDPDYVRWLKDLPVPVVSIGNRISDEIPFVGINDFEAASELVENVIRRDYSRFVIVCPPLRYKNETNIDAQEQRYLGFLHAIKRNYGDSAPITVIKEKDYSPLFRFVEEKNGSKGVILSTSDTFTIEALYLLKQRKIRIPQNVGIVSFDNISMLDYIEPRVCSVDQNVKEIGEKSIRALLDAIEGKKVELKYEIQYHISEGNSF